MVTDIDVVIQIATKPVGFELPRSIYTKRKADRRRYNALGCVRGRAFNGTNDDRRCCRGEDDAFAILGL